MIEQTYRVVIPAAGAGKRMGADRNKLMLLLRDRSIIEWTLDVFEADPLCEEIILAINPAEQVWFEQVTDRYATPVRLVAGGRERQESVLRGLEVIEAPGIVLIHDGARPFIEQTAIHAVVAAAVEHKAAILAVPVKDTVKRIIGETIVETVPRDELMAAQTPQAFDLDTIRTVHQKAAEHYLGTDDASLIEWDGGKVTLVTGQYENIKVTTPDDLWFGEAILMKRGK
ncbi:MULTISPECIES: 2-C-methyl-D-erythritol 4-phosphate cytidylyltransferase [unclassified Exiguobacterium]|uniref:2-C-methyl-D-erythritol 4-phosphate cytidylyltransferase n=1 Tax=unclassified Exiguobacterium TaxID=2644629 RepID=UPI000B58B9D2|nr:2-C-methyl-D-erythritol 4-phosphate cytidylyltransferase [Exiguobacterium sp. N4-1P]ASI34106.1 2-C-methyl-D-erythritol 4-phosphate cytidylyltransferase [Exiguobacterium sp. N4-1P]ASI37098.1 2-C-methyl-D-erythritol 4-phosphate cytidylyltransferase [Exiguobacterium sp. N4-1P]